MKTRRAGFTLLEVLVALTIIGLGFSVVFAGMSGSLRSLDRAGAAAGRVELARQKLAEIDLMKRIPPADSATGLFEDGTRWTIQTIPFIPPARDGLHPTAASIIRVDLTIEWQGRNGSQKQVIQTYRYQIDDSTPILPLQEQIRELQ